MNPPLQPPTMGKIVELISENHYLLIIVNTIFIRKIKNYSSNAKIFSLNNLQRGDNP